MNILHRHHQKQVSCRKDNDCEDNDNKAESRLRTMKRDALHPNDPMEKIGWKYQHNIQTAVIFLPTWFLQLYHLLSTASSTSVTTIPTSSSFSWIQTQVGTSHENYTLDPIQVAIIVMYILLVIYACDLSGYSRSLTLLAVWVLGFCITSLLFFYVYYQYYFFSVIDDGDTIHTISQLPIMGWILDSTMDSSVWLCWSLWISLQFLWNNDSNHQRELMQHWNTFEAKPKNREPFVQHTWTTFVSSSGSYQALEHSLHFMLSVSFSCICTRSLFHILFDLPYSSSFSFLVCSFMFMTCLGIGMVCHASLSHRRGLYEEVEENVISCNRNTKDSFALKEEEEEDRFKGHDSDKNDESDQVISLFQGRYLSWIFLFGPFLLYLFFLWFHYEGYKPRGSYDYDARLYFVETYYIWDIILVLSVPSLIHNLLIRKKYIWWWGHFQNQRQQRQKNMMYQSKVEREHKHYLYTHFSRWTQGKRIIACALLFWAVLFRFLIPLALTVTYHAHGVIYVQPLWLTSLYLLLSGSLFVLLLTLWLYKNKMIWQHLHSNILSEYYDDIFSIGLVSSVLIGAMACALPWKNYPLLFVAVLSLSLFLSTRMLRFMCLFLLSICSSMYVSAIHRFYHIQRFINILPGGIMQLSLFQFSLLIIFECALILLVWAFVVQAPVTSRERDCPVPNKDIVGFLLVIYCFIFVFVEAVLLSYNMQDHYRDLLRSPINHEKQTLYHPLYAVITTGLTFGVSWWLRHRKYMQLTSFTLISSLSIARFLSACSLVRPVDKPKDGNDIQLDYLTSTGVFFILFVVILAPFTFLDPIHASGGNSKFLNKAWSPSSTKVISPESGNGTSFTYLYTFFLLPLVIVSATPTMFRLLHGSHCHTNATISEWFGTVFVVWAVTMLLIVNHLLPDGGVDSFRKITSLIFLLGTSLLILHPSNPTFSSNNEDDGISSMYQATTRGLWGLIVVIIAILLSFSGLLNLHERNASGLKEKRFVLRLLVFSLLVSFGLTWFITAQIMGEQPFPRNAITLFSVLFIIFLGTLTIVLGIIIEENNFSDVLYLAKLWIYSFPVIFLLPSLLNQWISSSLKFPWVDWLSSYGIICGLSTISLSFSLKLRRDHSIISCALGNISSMISWILVLIIIYARNGIVSDMIPSGLGKFGFPASVYWTVLSSLMLLTLEKEKSDKSRSQQRIRFSHRSARIPCKKFLLPNYSHVHPLSVPNLASSFVFILTSLYVIFLRGCYHGDISNYQDLFASIVGEESSLLSATDSYLVSLIKKQISQNDAIAIYAKLAGSGFWTSDHMVGPIIHFLGVCSVVPCWFLQVRSTFWGMRMSYSQIVSASALCGIPIVFCYGIPSLRAAALLGLITGLHHSQVVKQSHWAGQMVI